MKVPYGITIFCDDVRDELFNKKTIVGVYGGEMVVGAFPAVLPTFGMVIHYLEPLEMPVHVVKIKVQISSENGDDVVLLEMDLPDDRPQYPGEKRDAKAEFRSHMLALKAAPLVIQSEGYIKVRAYVGGDEIRLGALNVRLPTEAETAAPPFSVG